MEKKLYIIFVCLKRSSLLEDYSQPMDEEQVWSVWEGNARVRR